MIIGIGCIHFKQKEWRHDSVLGLVYLSKHTLHVSWSSNCSLKEPRENPPSAITNTVQEVVVVTVYYKDSQGQRMCCNNRGYYVIVRT